MYRGAPNWETWAVHAWIANQDDVYFRWRERAFQTFNDCEAQSLFPFRRKGVDHQSAEAQRKLAAELRYYFTDPTGIVGGRSVYAQDVSEEDLQTVDWEHVADNLLSGINYDGIEYVVDGARNSPIKTKDRSGRGRKVAK
jgi:hypothetical protein